MEEDNNDYSPYIDSESNETGPMPKENNDEKEKIYISPDLNLINNNEKDKIKDDEIKESSKEKSIFDLNKDIKDLINDIDFILDDFLNLGPDKEKYKKLFTELRKRRKNDETITEEEYLLFDLMIQQFENPQKFNFDKMFKTKIDAKTELNISKNIVNEEKKDKDYYIHVYFILIEINNEITLAKENEENIITVNNNNKRTKNEMKEKKFFQCCSSCLKCFGSCLSCLCYFLTEYWEDHCKCCIAGENETINLHKSFIFCIIQYIIYGILLIIYNSYEFNEALIALLVVSCLTGVFNLYRLQKNKFSEGSNSIFYDFLCISLFKGMIYYFFYYLIKDLLQNENAYQIFIVNFCFMIAFLIICSFFLFAMKGLINFGFFITFGIAGILISSLILLFWFSVTEFIIELIISSIQMISFNLGILISVGKALLIPAVMWNTSVIETYKLSIFLFPPYIVIYCILFIYTCGFVCCRDY